MMVIDFTAQLAPFEMVLVGLLVIAIAGLVFCVDDPERKALRAWVTSARHAVVGPLYAMLAANLRQITRTPQRLNHTEQ